MKAAIVITGSGPILLLTSYDSLEHPDFLRKLETKGIGKFIGFEPPMELVREKYRSTINLVMADLHQTDDLRVLDYNGDRVLYRFSFAEMGDPLYHEAPRPHTL